MNKTEAELLPIRVIGDEVLRQKAKPIKELTEEIRKFIRDLTYTMYEEDGVGLAAPQVGKSWRLFVVDPNWYREGYNKAPRVLINPEIKKLSGEEQGEEGCLSLPGLYGRVNRAEKVVIEGLNEEFEPVRYEAEGFFARSLQHENDHLDGILFVDILAPLQKIMLNKKIAELKKTTKEGVNIKQKEHENI